MPTNIVPISDEGAGHIATRHRSACAASLPGVDLTFCNCGRSLILVCCVCHAELFVTKYSASDPCEHAAGLPAIMPGDER